MKLPILEKLIQMLPPTEGKIDVFENAPLFLYRNSFTAIVAVLEARDKYTANHSEQVSVMIQRFCKVLHILPLQLEAIEMMASVHDIGKVGVPDAVLNKPGKLNDDEWAQMCRHPIIGAEILLKAGRLKYIAEGVLYHHERWNGTGYPEGLKGTEIPYASRLIAICDSVDAMLSNRVYRKALSVDTCKEELIKGKGEMYDPEMTQAFLDNWDKIVAGLYG